MSIRVNLVVLRSQDIDSAVGFYEKLGISFVKHAHGNGPEHYSCEAEGLVFELYPATQKSPVSKSARIGFEVDSIEAVVARLEALGATIVSAPKASQWGIRAVVRDLDGHSVELLSKPNREHTNESNP